MKIKLANGTMYDGVVNINPTSIDGVETSQAEIIITSGVYDTIKRNFNTLENIAVIEVMNEQGYPLMDPLVSYSYYSITEMNNGSIVVTMIKDEISSKIKQMQEQVSILQDEMLNQQTQFEGGELLNSAILLARMQARELSDVEALQVKNLYNAWEKDVIGYAYSRIILMTSVVHMIIVFGIYKRVITSKKTGIQELIQLFGWKLLKGMKEL